MKNKKGFVMILAVSVFAVIIVLAQVIVNIGFYEIFKAGERNDLVSAYYCATAGEELMFATLSSKSTIIWPETIAKTSLVAGGVTIGDYYATANIIPAEPPTEFYIVSTGKVNGHYAQVTARYGCHVNGFTGPTPLGAIGDITLNGASDPAKIKMDGPVMSNGTVATTGDVDIANGTQNGVGFSPPNFWSVRPHDTAKFNMNNDADYAVDSNEDGIITRSEAIAQGKEAAFNADNIYAVGASADQIDTGDALFYYYTTWLNNPANNRLEQTLNIAPDQSNYYSGDQTFDQGDIPNNVPIIFVNGNVTINYNDQDWQGSDTLAHTVVAMGDIHIQQPTNRPGDILTLVANGNVSTDGTMGNKGGTIGDLVIYAKGNFTATNGGKMNASIFVEGTASIDTIGDDEGKDHRMINAITTQWTEATEPLGLPPGYPTNISTGFSVSTESAQRSRWQRSYQGIK